MQQTSRIHLPVSCALLAFCALLALTAVAPPPAESARVLAVYPFPGKSHFMMHNALVRLLLQHGHEVTYVTPYSIAKEQLGANYTEVLVPAYDFWADIKERYQLNSLIDMTKMTTFDFLDMMVLLGIKSTEHVLQSPAMQAIIDAKVDDGVAARQYDLLLTEQFYNEAMLALAYKYRIPIVTTCTFGYANYLSQMVGIISPWSYVPHAYIPTTDRMNLWQRMQNIFISLYEDVLRIYSYLPQQEALVRKYFGHLPVHLPSITEMERNVSVLLLNSYMPLTSARPTSFNMIPVGGMHIYPAQALPERMRRFLDEAEAGVIYFSLGTNVRSSDMTPEMVAMFFRVFASLPQRVLWKFEDDQMPGIPANVMVQKWMPQSDILAHHNVRVFITHGGLLGTQEGVYHGVPMLGMPVYCDQLLNMGKAVTGGYALSFNFQTITEAQVRGALSELLDNPAYRVNMQRVSGIFRDRPQGPRETALYWMEYVMRHGGAPHMHAAGVDLAWYEFYLLDVAAILIAALVVPIWIACVCCKRRRSANRKVKKS